MVNPTVTALDVVTGTTAGGTAITITGTGFAADATVTIGGTAATSVVVVSATSITAVTPAGTAGAKDVVVTNTDNGVGTGAELFTYTLATPTLNAMAANTIAATGAGNYFVSSAAGADDTKTKLTFTYGADFGGTLEYVIVANGVSPTTGWANAPATTVQSSNLTANATGDLYVRVKAVSGVSNASSAQKALETLVVGAAAADTTAPTLSSSSPASTDRNIAVGSNIVLTFSENIARGTGSITIKKHSDDTTVELFNVATSSQITVSGAVLTIDPTVSLANSTDFYVLIEAGAITDISGNAYAGIADKEVLRFATAAAPTSPPVVVTPVTVSTPNQTAISVVVPDSLEVGKTATLTTTGGAATGTSTYLTNSITICTVTSAGVVTAVAAGTCSVYAQRTAAGFTTAVSADVTFKIMSAAEVKAIADAAVKAAADKAAADAAAAAVKAAADKAEAEAKTAEAAAAVAAEAARVEAVRLAGLNTVTSIKTVKGKTSIALNLADKYYGYILELQLRTVVKGKARFTTIEYFAVERLNGVVTVSTRAKIAKGQQLRILSDGKVVRTFLR